MLQVLRKDAFKESGHCSAELESIAAKLENDQRNDTRTKRSTIHDHGQGILPRSLHLY